MKHNFIRVYGRVQGVGFRYFTQRLAHKYDIVGYVKNVQDFVEVDAQGSANNLKLFTDAVINGASPASDVTDYTIETKEIDTTLKEFKAV
ncbi:acylphosphatase [Staphylococcus hyicus]|uniref:Acylphosphatase n=2 Tax=Staphylococcus hyicus TaxID=1284 RepID=A0ACD5FM38_STAHY|nr:acylphosphatase [Staphylococcus hyicus]MCE5153035.1 acylphosphatase [Staphylococcus hyicus]MCO4328402.1 acylphosphatase [Staphylococcus hyicus]MCO4331199.1 acylphosphatase [Staphylococcus hyicus]MCO4334137.1 acylphosphatase [Staphylococcus hyicus]MCO4336087.1 acylphosphatase [Staphylococcus hyicus]